MVTMSSAPASAWPRGRPRRVPDVLADVDGEHHVAQREDRGLGAGLEVAVLVEDAVVRQVLLVVGAGVHAVVQHGGGIEDVVALVHESDHRGETAAGPRHVGERPQVGLDEGGLEERDPRGDSR